MPAKKSNVDVSATEPLAAPSFEESLGEIQTIVSQLEGGSLSLEESMGQFERGVSLLRSCYQVLEHAEQRIEILTGSNRSGVPETDTFDASATLNESTAPQQQPTRRQSSVRPSAGQLFGE